MYSIVWGWTFLLAGLWTLDQLTSLWCDGHLQLNDHLWPSESFESWQVLVRTRWGNLKSQKVLPMARKWRCFRGWIVGWGSSLGGRWHRGGGGKSCPSMGWELTKVGVGRNAAIIDNLILPMQSDYEFIDDGVLVNKLLHQNCLLGIELDLCCKLHDHTWNVYLAKELMKTLLGYLLIMYH